MKVAVIGSRGLSISNLGEYLPQGTTEIVSGGARGVDTSAREYVMANGKVQEAAEKLTASLTPEQQKLWNEYELAASLVEGETKREYYKNGVRDSVLIVVNALSETE